MHIYYRDIFIQIVVLGTMSRLADCSCSFPLSDGVWVSSTRDTWTVTNNSVTINNFKAAVTASSSTVQLTCVSTSGVKHVFSTTVEILTGIQVLLYICIEVKSFDTTTNKIVFYVITPFSASTGDTFTSDDTTACDNTDYATTYNTGIVILRGGESDIGLTLPGVIRGSYAVNYTDVGSSSVTLATMDSCSNTTVMRFNSSANVAFSADGWLQNVYSIQSNDTYYVWTYNNDTLVDGSTTYTFACWVFTSSTPGVLATVYPEQCPSTQTSSSVPSGGQIVTFVPDYVCVDSSSGTDSGVLSTTIMIIIVVCIIVGILLIVIIFVCIWKWKRRKADKHIRQLPNSQHLSEKSNKGTKRRNISTQTDNGTVRSKTPKDKMINVSETKGSKSNKRFVNFRILDRFKKNTPKPQQVNGGITFSHNRIDSNYKLRRYKTTLGTIKSPDPKPIIKVQSIPKHSQRFIPGFGSIKIDTRSKSMIDSFHRTHSYIAPNTSDTKTSKKINESQVTESMERSKTKEDFAREFDTSNPFPIIITTAIHDTGLEPVKSDLSNTDIEEQKTTTTSDRTTAKSTSRKRRNTADNILNKQPKPVVKRTVSEGNEQLMRSVAGFSYNSPYALTVEQKQYMARKGSWVHHQLKSEENQKQQLEEAIKQENKMAFQLWMRQKQIEAENIRTRLRTRSKERTFQNK